MYIKKRAKKKNPRYFKVKNLTFLKKILDILNKNLKIFLKKDP